MKLSAYYEEVLGVRVPLGAYLTIDHEEACSLTSLDSAGAVVVAIKAACSSVPIVAAVGAAIYITSKALRAANEKSGGKGLRLRYSLALGIIDEVKKLGKGPSPCPEGMNFVGDPSPHTDLNELKPLPFEELNQDEKALLLNLPELGIEGELY
jgi:hypothetical protein